VQSKTEARIPVNRFVDNLKTLFRPDSSGRSAKPPASGLASSVGAGALTRRASARLVLDNFPAFVVGRCDQKGAGGQFGGLFIRAVAVPEQGKASRVRHQFNRAKAACTLSRCIGHLLLVAEAAAQIAHA
jgi:hypothetical protein